MTRTDPPVEVRTGVAVAVQTNDDTRSVVPSDVDAPEVQEDVLTILKREVELNKAELQKLKAELSAEVGDVSFFAKRVNRHIDGLWVAAMFLLFILVPVVVALICQGSAIESNRLMLKNNVTARLDLLEAPVKAAALVKEQLQMFFPAGLNSEMLKPSSNNLFDLATSAIVSYYEPYMGLLVILALYAFLIVSSLCRPTNAPSPNDVLMTADKRPAPIGPNPPRGRRRGSGRPLPGGPWPSHPAPVASSSTTN
jgi:hypothetical protein